MAANATATATRTQQSKSYPTSLEPSSLVDAFMAHPPEGFVCRSVEQNGNVLPTFSAGFDILTTLDDEQGSAAKWLRNSSLVRSMAKVPTLFVGTTVSEYAPVPTANQFGPLLKAIKHTTRTAQLIIIKDIPHQSPLLSDEGNQASQRLIDECSKESYFVLEGQALAYVPIDFATIDEYLAKLSHTRRKEFRKKLKSRSLLTIGELPTGSSDFDDENFVNELYRLYLNVYAQSEYHFDKLSKSFFEAVLTDATNGGIVFVYYQSGKLIGFNLCFTHNEYLVDKYIGLSYPAARDCNLYFVSWFVNLEYALRHQLTHYIAGWTDPEVKRALGASFTFTKHAVFACNPILRFILKKFQRFFEPDSSWAERTAKP